MAEVWISPPDSPVGEGSDLEAPPRPLPIEYWMTIYFDDLEDEFAGLEPADPLGLYWVRPAIIAGMMGGSDPDDHERDHLPCPSCDGAGEYCIGSTTATWYDPPEAIMERCPDCDDWRGERVYPLDLEEFEEIFCCNLETSLEVCHT